MGWLMDVRYHYDEIITETVKAFCEHALAEAELPDEIMYDVASESLQDAFRENVYCEIELKHARVLLSFGVFSAVPEEHPGEQVFRRPSVVALQATMIDADRGLAVWSDNGWIWTAE